jgi:hypothetical protein
MALLNTLLVNDEDIIPPLVETVIESDASKFA